jgi:RES domain-containing protein
MRLYRLSRRDAAAAVDGIGSSQYPGRWNERGRRAVYLSTRIPVALLEVLVQAGNAPLHGYRAYPVEVPDADVTRLDRSQLPGEWRTAAGRDACRSLGEAWRTGRHSVGLLVPSAVIPEAYDEGDYNVVLDPTHPAFSRVRVGAPIALALDDRLHALVAGPQSTQPRRSSGKKQKRS